MGLALGELAEKLEDDEEDVGLSHSDDIDGEEGVHALVVTQAFLLSLQ